MWHLQIKTEEGRLIEFIDSEDYELIKHFLQSYDIEQSLKSGWELTVWLDD